MPKTYRSRHDPHYVEHLISERAMPLLRVLPSGAIDAADLPDPAQLSALKESIARFGVLQPLVVRAHDGRFTLIAGRRRLAAAREAGLREVPCLVHSVDEAQAAALAEALNAPAHRVSTRPDVSEDAAGTTSLPCDPVTLSALAEVQDALVTIRSALPWLPRHGGGTRERVMGRLLRADLERAEWAVTARQYLAGALRVAPVATDAADVLADVGRLAAAIALHGGTLKVAAAPAGLRLSVDRALLAAAVRGLAWTLLAVGEAAGDRRIQVAISSAAAAKRTMLALSQPSVVLTQPSILRFFEEGWPGRPGGAMAELAVRLTRYAATRHGAGLEVSSAAGEGTTVTMAFE